MICVYEVATPISPGLRQPALVGESLAKIDVGRLTSAPSLRLVEQRCCEFWLGARREEGEYLLWSLTDEQQSTRPKSAQPFGLGRGPGPPRVLASFIRTRG